MTAKKTMIDALIFDSGVGGLSILSEILRLRPELSYAYIADTAGLPYGDKSDAWLLQRVSAVLALVLRQFEPGIVVIACNTASTLVLQDIRAQVSIPVVGVVPAIKPAAALSRSHVIGLLATPATVQRPYIDQLIQDFAGNCQVIRLGNSRLVELAEQKLRGETFSIDEIRDIVQIFRLAEPQPDTLVLGCTHFPLLQSELQSVLPNIMLVDSGLAIAQRVDALIPETTHLHRNLSHKILFTKWDSEVEKLRPYLSRMGFTELLELKG